MKPEPLLMSAMRCLIGPALFLIPCGQALANGGGYSSGGVEQTGSITRFEPEDTGFIAMEDEQLTVHLGPSSARVEIHYRMRNTTQRKVTVKFGFPVEESTGFSDFAPERSTKKSNRPAYCQDYQITARGAAIKSTWHNEPPGASDTRRNGLSGWQVSAITFAPNEELPVTIRFNSLYPFSHFSVSDDSSSSAAIFKYRLSTAACWAGPIGTGRITLKPDGIDPSELRVLKPVSRFKKDGSSWVWNFENLEPTMADDMEIEAAPTKNSYSRSVNEKNYDGPRVTYTERAGNWSVEHCNYKVTASSTLPPQSSTTYSADHLKTRQGTWSEGNPGPGIGEWIEINPLEPKPLNAILMRPGYDHSLELYNANARPKRVNITLNGEHTFLADIPDRMDQIRIPVRQYNKPVRSIRIVFNEVWPGSRFEDLCVSGVSLSVKLDRKPKITPQR